MPRFDHSTYVQESSRVLEIGYDDTPPESGLEANQVQKQIAGFGILPQK